jgi:uncharacterized protein (UPF0332 family)
MAASLGFSAVSRSERSSLKDVNDLEGDQPGEFGFGESLFQDARWRSAVSRSYYAAYAAVSGAWEGLAQYPKGRFGPSHDRLPKLVMTYLTELRFYERARVVKAARRLYRQRISADYEPPELVELEEARIAIQDASFILRSMSDAKN